MSGQAFTALLLDVKNKTDSKISKAEHTSAWLPATIEMVAGEARIKNCIAGNVKVTMARNFVSKSYLGVRDGRPVHFTKTEHLGESNFLKQQEVASEGSFVDECSRGKPNLMNVHRKFIRDKRDNIPLDGSVAVIRKYGRHVRQGRRSADKWDCILSQSIKAALPEITGAPAINSTSGQGKQYWECDYSLGELPK